MKSRIGLRLIAISASAVVLLTASFAKQVSNTGCSDRNIRDAVNSKLATEVSSSSGEVVHVEEVSGNGNTFTVSLAGVVPNDGRKKKVLNVAKNAVNGCAIVVNGTKLVVRCPSDPMAIEARIRDYFSKFLPTCVTENVVIKVSEDRQTVVLKGNVPSGRANPNLQMTYKEAVVEVAQSAFCGNVDFNKLIPGAPGSAGCVVVPRPKPGCPTCPPECSPGHVLCGDLCLEGTRCPRIN